jgi:hypothetical protein
LAKNFPTIRAPHPAVIGEGFQRKNFHLSAGPCCKGFIFQNTHPLGLILPRALKIRKNYKTRMGQRQKCVFQGLGAKFFRKHVFLSGRLCVFKLEIYFFWRENKVMTRSEKARRRIIFDTPDFTYNSDVRVLIFGHISQ